MMMHSLDHVKAGDEVFRHDDEVFRHGTGWRRSVERVTVTRTTKTRVYVGTTYYHRRDGYQPGERAWRYGRIAPVNPETEAEYATLLEEEAARKLAEEIGIVVSSKAFQSWPLPALEAVRNALEQHKPGDDDV